MPLFQIMSFGTVGVGAVTLVHSYLLSLRRNDLSLANAGGSAAMYVVLVPLGWLLGGTAGVAVAVTVTSLLSLALAHALAARASRRPLAPAARAYVGPTLLGLLACGPSWAIVTFAWPADGAHGPLARLVAGLAVFAALYPPLLWALCREAFGEIVRRVPTRLAGPLRRGWAAQA